MGLLRSITVALVTTALVFWGVPARAVVKNVMLQDVNGKPVANAVVTVYNSKDEEIAQRTTDNKGLLVYDFPEGKNVVRWKGGSQEVLVAESKARGDSFFSGSTGLIVAGALGVGLIAALAGGGGGGGGDSTATPDTGTGTGTGTDTGTGTTPVSTVPKAADLAGTYSMSGTKTADSCNSAANSYSNSSVAVTASGTQLTIKDVAIMNGDYSETSGQTTLTGTGADGGTETLTLKFETKDGKISASGTRSTEDSSVNKCSVSYSVTLTKN